MDRIAGVWIVVRNAARPPRREAVPVDRDLHSELLQEIAGCAGTQGKITAAVICRGHKKAQSARAHVDRQHMGDDRSRLHVHVPGILDSRKELLPHGNWQWAAANIQRDSPADRQYGDRRRESDDPSSLRSRLTGIQFTSEKVGTVALNNASCRLLCSEFLLCL